MKTPFSEDTLREAREKLLARNLLLRERTERVRADLRRNGETFPPDEKDVANDRENDDVLLAIERAANAEIARIDAALKLMEEGSFGLCEECGQEIEPARLIAHPYAAHCRNCSAG